MHSFGTGKKTKDKAPDVANATNLPVNSRRYFFVVDVQSPRDLSQMNQIEAAHWAFLALSNDLHQIKITAYDKFTDLTLDFATNMGPFLPGTPGAPTVAGK
jgi:hypothetical protein